MKNIKKDKVAIWGASAGGITVGRAMTERPDLLKQLL
jgi:prolyl oligopeptidase